ncbi:hypothetical protein [Gramella sp. AN32]|uniref:Uncharacterized protein n=1 Tax=Christiangramia antarctica TaxID=2058158 RepID=A0ABW5X2T5_9FLAO|nr:hypothetical protein [Gramella sp. AN32]
MELIYNFDVDAEGWTGGFADYPIGEEDFYELEFAYSSLPSPLDETDGAIILSGNNHSDDLFMFIKKKVTGLNPNTIYNIKFEIEFASNVPQGFSGIGGSPGESVYIKAGAAGVEPVVSAGNENLYHLNIDKGNQSQGGSNMIVVGNFSNDSDDEVYRLKIVGNSESFLAKTNANGELWLITGTDSGFEGTTTIYFNSIKVLLEK